MTALCITSTQDRSGKTTITAGLGKYLADKGKKVGYLKLVAAEDSADASFMKSVLNLDEPPEKLALTRDGLAKVKEAYQDISSSKEIILIEVSGKDVSQVAEALDARVIAVENSISHLGGYKNLGKRLLGAIIDKVPKSQLDKVKEQAKSVAGVKILGVLPEDRSLAALTVAELASLLQGKVLNGDTQLAELVENIMLGAMYVDSGLEYFGRKSNKAVVLRSERPDMQLAALETSTKCLVLTGDKPLISMVLHRAKEKKVPIILTAGNVAATVDTIEKALSEERFKQVGKLPRLMDIMRQGLDLITLNQELGLAR